MTSIVLPCNVQFLEVGHQIDQNAFKVAADHQWPAETTCTYSKAQKTQYEIFASVCRQILTRQDRDVLCFDDKDCPNPNPNANHTWKVIQIFPNQTLNILQPTNELYSWIDCIQPDWSIRRQPRLVIATAQLAKWLCYDLYSHLNGNMSHVSAYERWHDPRECRSKSERDRLWSMMRVQGTEEVHKSEKRSDSVLEQEPWIEKKTLNGIEAKI